MGSSYSDTPVTMKVLCLVVLGLAARPSDIIDFEPDNMEHEQEGIPGTAVEGEYSWIDATGTEYVVKYVADHLGYRVVEDTAIPGVADIDLADDAPEARAAEIEEEDEDDEDDESPMARAAEIEEDE